MQEVGHNIAFLDPNQIFTVFTVFGITLDQETKKSKNVREDELKAEIMRSVWSLSQCYVAQIIADFQYARILQKLCIADLIQMTKVTILCLQTCFLNASTSISELWWPADPPAITVCTLQHA